MQHKGPYLVDVKSMPFWMFPNTFNANYAKAALLLLDNYGAKPEDTVLDMFAGKEAKALLAWIQELDQKGTDFSVVVSELLTRFHDVMLEQYGVSPQTGTEHDAIVKKFTQKELAYLMRLLSRAHQETKTWYIEPLPLELAVVEYCSK